MTTLKEYKAHRKELKAQIKEAKAILQRLEAELEKERLEMQHDEVDHLDEYIHKAEPHLADLKKLGLSALDDFRASMHNLMGAVRGDRKDKDRD